MAKRKSLIELALVSLVSLLTHRVVSGQAGTITKTTQPEPPTITTSLSGSVLLTSHLRFPNSQTCGFSETGPFSCDDGSTCTLLATSQPAGSAVARYAGCCSDGQPCNIFTTCYPSEESEKGVGDPRAMVCTGSLSRCWSFWWWPGSFATAFACASSGGSEIVNWAASTTTSASGSQPSVSFTVSTTGAPGPTGPPNCDGDNNCNGNGNGNNNGGGGNICVACESDNPGPLSLGGKIGLGVGFGMAWVVVGVAFWRYWRKKEAERQRAIRIHSRPAIGVDEGKGD